MGTKGEQFIVTYYGLDGACAAADGAARRARADAARDGLVAFPE